MVADGASLFWLPAGIATALLFHYGLRLAPLLAVLAYLVNHDSQQWPTAIGMAIGSTAAPALCAYWLRQWQLSPFFRRRRDTQTLIAAAAIATTVSALNGTLWLLGAGKIDSSQFFNCFSIWYFGDLSGVICVSPVLLAWPAGIRDLVQSRRQRMLIALDTIALIAILIIVFLSPFDLGFWILAFAFAPFVAIIRVAALRGAWPAALHLLIVLGFAFDSLLQNVGPLKFLPPEIRTHVVWGYITALAITSLITSGLIGDCENAESQLRIGDAYYKALVEDNPALICRFHIDGLLAFANETFRRTFSIATGMTAGENFFELSGLDGNSNFLHRLEANRFGDPAVTADCRMTFDSGVYWFRWSARVVREVSGQGVEFHAVGLDISEQMRAEAERRQIERQAVLHQKLETVGALAGGISHEFNNLLTGVMGNAELVEMNLPPKSSSSLLQMLADIRTGARRAAELSQQLLNYSIRGSLHRGPLDLSQTLRSVQDLLSVAMPKRCRMDLELGDGLALIAADESRVRQLLMSLVLNAGEAASETSGSVAIRTRCVYFNPETDFRSRFVGNTRAGWYVMLQIEDRGPGMTDEVRSRIFQPFYSTKFPGRGLGLAAVLGIVRDYNGAIGVCTREGLGTCVSVLFQPINVADAILGKPEDHAAHGSDCVYCRVQADDLTSVETTAGARPPLPQHGIGRTGHSSFVHSRGRRVQLGFYD